MYANGSYFSANVKMYTDISLTIDNDMLETEAINRAEAFFRSKILNNNTGYVKDSKFDYCFRMISDPQQWKFYRSEWMSRPDYS